MLLKSHAYVILSGLHWYVIGVTQTPACMHQSTPTYPRTYPTTLKHAHTHTHTHTLTHTLSDKQLRSKIKNELTNSFCKSHLKNVNTPNNLCKSRLKNVNHRHSVPQYWWGFLYALYCHVKSLFCGNCG